jgi:hypothetical protein
MGQKRGGGLFVVIKCQTNCQRSEGRSRRGVKRLRCYEDGGDMLIRNIGSYKTHTTTFQRSACLIGSGCLELFAENI